MTGIVRIGGWVALGLALLVSFALDFNNNAQGGAIDLRNRITGIRLLENHIDAYHYKWSPSEPKEYCDLYNNPKTLVSKTTATPTLLMLHAPWAVLPYRLGQFLWFFIQWALLLGTTWLWWPHCTTSRQRWLLALFVTGFTYTAAWRLHAERGQAYILLAFVFAAWLTATLDAKRGNGFLTGALGGFLAALRPPFLLILPFLALHRRGQLPGAIVGLLVGIGLPMLWSDSCWNNYFTAMQTQSMLYRTDFAPHYALAYPPLIEGVHTLILGYYVPIAFADFSAHAFLRWLGCEPFPELPVLLVVVVPFAMWLWLARTLSIPQLLIGLAAWLFIFDLFLPAYRNTYNDVLIINIVAFALTTTSRIPWAAWPCLIALPLGWLIYAFSPEQAWLINLPTFFFTLGAVALLFLFNNGADVRKV